MYHPNEVIEDIRKRLDRMVLDFKALLEEKKQLETENKSLAQSLEEALNKQEILSQRLDTIRQETARDTKDIAHWKSETRKEIRGIRREVDKCIPQVESLLEKKHS